MKLINTALICIGMISSYSQGMSCEDLFKYALENSPIIKNSNLDVNMAEQQIKQALTTGYPKINGSLSFQNFIDIPTTVVPASAFNPMATSDELLGLQFGTDYNANYSLQLDQLIFSFSYIYGIQTAKSYKQLTELIKLKSYDDLLYEVKIAVGNHVFITKNIAFVKENLLEIESLINKTDKMITGGFLDKTAINELEFLKLEMQSLANDLDHKLNTNTYSLKNKIGYPIDSSIDITNQFPSGLSTFIDFKLDEK
ncbi:MAG: TolC family protein, partial [Bacteroidota bacterium]|nr:TolC family protein [Bacteroidota bacterium]